MAHDLVGKQEIGCRVFRRCQAARGLEADDTFRVFLAPFWEEIFSQDTERKQTRAEAEATCAVMRETYTALGYEITELPRTDIGSRADFVCGQLAV